MAKVYENDCVHCDSHCINCGLKRNPHWYCDECGEEFNTCVLYDYDGEMLCAECLLNKFETIEQKGCV